MATIFGEGSDLFELQKNYPVTAQDSSDQWKMEFLYVVNKEIAYDEGVLPVQNSIVPAQFAIPGVTVNLVLTSKRFTVHEMPGFFNLRLVYTLPKSEATGFPVREGDTTLEGNTTFREIPIEQETDLSDSAMAELKAKGEQTKSAFSSQFTNTTVQKDESISEEELISGVGKRSNPIGLTDIGASYEAEEVETKRWLLTSKQISTIQGGNRQLRQTWTYSEKGWTDLLYADEDPA